MTAPRRARAGLAALPVLLLAMAAQGCADASGGGGAEAAAVPAARDVGPPGSLAAGFGRDGRAEVEVGPDARAYGMAIQPDGRIAVAGSAPGADGGERAFAAARFTTAGSPDGDFGEGGVVRLPLDASAHEAMAVAAQPDGKLVLAGYVPKGAYPEFAVARLHVDGAPDEEFGQGGSVRTGMAYGIVPAAVAVTGDGRVVVAGTASDAGGQYFALARYTPRGAPDATFGSEGEVMTTYTGPASGLALLPDGRAVVAGSSVVLTGTSMGALRYGADGKLDRTFGEDGRAWTRLESLSGGQAVAVQPDGAVVVAGYTRSGSDAAYEPAVVRFTADGALDPAFGEGGKARVPVDGGQDENVAIALQPDGKVVLLTRGPGGFAVTRLLPDGSRDAGFGTGGTAVVPAGEADVPRAVAVHDGRIFVLGQSEGRWTVHALRV